MSEKSLKETLEAFGIKKILKLMGEDPDKSLPKLLDWVDRLDRSNVMARQRKVIHEILDNPDNNWYRLIKSLWTDIDPAVRQTVFENFVCYSAILGCKRQEKNKEKYGCNIPWAILLDPSSACNLHCKGCWAAEYGSKLNMDYAALEDIIRQGKSLGTYMYIFTGGEPLVRKDDIIRLCEEHDDCMFLAFTNGTLIDEKFADEMLRVKNFLPAISVEGDEEQTDDRRGKGTYQAVIKAMEILKNKKLPFGASLCYTRKNAETIASDAYFDDLIERGCKFAWLFTFLPIGVNAPTDLLATAGQRELLHDQIRKFRDTKPIFTMDFWNDGEYVTGCIGGGRCYLHINANGDVEPCAFIHYSDSNIREKSLLEALQSPLFMQYKEGQPFNENLLRPCPLLDNQGKLAEMVHKSGAYSTDLSEPEDVEALCAKCKCAADDWAPVADRLWNTKRENTKKL